MGKQLVAGVDEVGRGCLAGPVFSAAVILDKDKKIKGLKDSKLLSPKKRFSLFEEIKFKAISIGIGSCSPKMIDRINIREATFFSMRVAVKNLSVKPNKIDVREITQTYTNIFSAYIRKHPEQYFWFHRRWKTKLKNDKKN